MNENDHADLCPVIWNFYYEYDENEWYKVIADFIGGQEMSWD